MQIFIYIFSNQMETCELTVNAVVKYLGNSSSHSISQTVITYLQLQDLQVLSALLTTACSNNAFARLICTQFFLRNYLNKVDRTFYYNFYENSEFIQLENAHAAFLHSSYSNEIINFPGQYNSCLSFIKGLLPHQLQPEDFVEELQKMLTDTSIPLPKLKRENQGIFCRTSFQNFLVDLKYQKGAALGGLYPPFEEIQAYFETQEQKYLQKLFMKAAKEPSMDYKVRSLRFTPFQITYQNQYDFFIEKNSLHNLLVAVYALTDVLLTSLQTYLESLQDPFHRFVELITRYSIYRNYVIQVEENLSFAFEQYDTLYSEVFGSDKPHYRFWRGAMTKWLLKFSPYHQDCNMVYYYCLTKLRTEEALRFLDGKEKEDPASFMQIKNKASLRQYELTVNETILNGASNGVEDFFSRNPEQYTVILIQYLEYMVDLSINEETVHWCGHSNQPLSEPFLSFEKVILKENKGYLNYIRRLQNEGQVDFIKEYFTRDMAFLESIQVKPLVLRKMVDCYNMELVDSPTLTETFVGISYDFETSDETLRYFNEKVKVKFMIQENQMCFYSISPILPADEILTKSISTTYASDCHNSEQEESDSQMEHLSNSSSIEDEESEEFLEENMTASLSQVKRIHSLPLQKSSKLLGMKGGSFDQEETKRQVIVYKQGESKANSKGRASVMIERGEKCKESQKEEFIEKEGGRGECGENKDKESGDR